MNILKHLEETRNLSKLELAKILDISKSNYSDLYRELENNTTILSIKKALKIHEHFGISLEEIYGITKEQQEAGLSATTTATITPLEDDLLEVFRTIGENLGEPAQRAFLAIGESIAKNSQ